jgi:hypothetical protein
MQIQLLPNVNLLEQTSRLHRPDGTELLRKHQGGIDQLQYWFNVPNAKWPMVGSDAARLCGN